MMKVLIEIVKYVKKQTHQIVGFLIKKPVKITSHFIVFYCTIPNTFHCDDIGGPAVRTVGAI